MQDTPEGFLTVKQVAEVMAVKPSTVRAWLRAGRIQGVRIGKDWRVPVAAVRSQTTAAILDRLARKIAALPPERLSALVDALGGET
jgi:excisionase family DNA binding protein